MCWKMEEEDGLEEELRGRVEKSRKVGHVRMRGISRLLARQGDFQVCNITR